MPIVADALKFTDIPFIEIHISNVHMREPFRQHSYLSEIAVGLIVALGPQGYDLDAQYAIEHLQGKEARSTTQSCASVAIPLTVAG